MRTRKLANMGRRRFLNTLSAIGVSSGALELMTADALAEVTADPTKEVPRIEARVHTNHEEVVEEDAPPEREPVYYTIPRDQWARVEAAHKAAERLERRVRARLDGVENSGLLRFGVNQSGGEYKICVDRDTIEDWGTSPSVTAEELEEMVPATVTETVGTDEFQEEVEDIPVTVNDRTISLASHGYSHYAYEYRPVPAGCQLYAYNSYENRWDGATSCCRAWDGSESILLTCAHLFGASGEGNNVYQPYESNPSIDGSCGGNTCIGKCEESVFRWEDERSWKRDDEADRAFDWATIRMHSDVDVTAKFAADDGTYRNWEVYGIIEWDNIKDGTSLRKQGIATEYETGDVYKTFTNETFETEAACAGGDSGGPNFKRVYYEYPTSFMGIAGVTSYNADNGTGVIWSGKAESEFGVTI